MAQSLDDVLRERGAQLGTQQSTPLGLDEVRRLANFDLRNGLDRGALRAMAQRCTPAQRLLVDWLLEQGERERAGEPKVEPIARNPVMLDPPSTARQRQRDLLESVRGDGASTPRPGLGASDIEWIRRLPIEVERIDEADVHVLNGLLSRAADASEKRLLLSVMRPIHALHARRIERAQLQQVAAERPPLPAASIAATQVAEMFQHIAVGQISSEVPELTPNETIARARAQYLEVVGTNGTHPLVAAHAERVAAARKRLAEIAAAEKAEQSGARS